MNIKLGVVGTPGGWSSEKLADTVAAMTGYRLLIDMSRLSLDLTEGRAWFEGTDVSALDGLIIKKIGAWYSPDLLDDQAVQGADIGALEPGPPIGTIQREAGHVDQQPISGPSGHRIGQLLRRPAAGCTDHAKFDRHPDTFLAAFARA